MKRIALASFLACSIFALHAQITETATDAVKNMGLGWNLGNTLDANSGTGTDITAASYWGKQGLDSETCWGQPTTTPELIKMMKEAGFGAIRVPVTWYNHMDKDGKVDAAWMKRVHEVVDYVIGNGLYCIINVHHDTGADSDSFVHWIHADESNYTKNKDKFEYLWKQIAEEFKDYDNHLLFAGYNEMLDKLSSWCYASFNASGKYNAATATSAYNAINSYADSFVKTVRSTGGNNKTRNLIIPTYAAANGYGSWSTHLKETVTKLVFPESAGHLIAEVHAYPSIQENGKDRSISSIKSEVDGMIKVLTDNFVNKNYPAIFGEWGTGNVDSGAGKTDYDLRKSLMFQFCEYFVQKTKDKGIGTFYWMGLSDGRYRAVPAFNQADLAEKIAKAYHGSSFNGVYPEPEIGGDAVAFEGDRLLEWGTGTITIEADYFKSIGSNVQLELTYKLDFTDYDDIQFFYGDWDKVNKVSVKVDGKSFEMDFSPSSHYGIATGAEKTTTFTFDEKIYTLLSQKGMIIQGHGVRVYKAVVSDSTKSSLGKIEQDNADAAIYDILGRRVTKMTNGIYIRQGRKVIHY